MATNHIYLYLFVEKPRNLRQPPSIRSSFCYVSLLHEKRLLCPSRPHDQMESNRPNKPDKTSPFFPQVFLTSLQRQSPRWSG